MNHSFKISIGSGSLDIIKSHNNEKHQKYNIKENEQDILQKKYNEYMDNVVEQIKDIKWGEKIYVNSEPFINLSKYRNCIITKNIRFSTYIFSGRGSKKILRYFMKKTENDNKYGYKNILQIINTKKQRQYIPIICLKKFWNNYKDVPVKDRFIFEVICSDRPCKPYLDIEWKAINNNIQNKYNIFITHLIKDIKNIFQNRYNIELNDSDILISSSHSKTKVSFHIVINRYIDNKLLVYNTNKKGYKNSAWDLWRALVDINQKYKDVIDESVYSIDREFRTLYSNKIEQYRPFVPYGKTIRQDTKIRTSTKKCLQYFVTYFNTNIFYFISTPDIDNIQYNYNIYSPKIYTNNKINNLIKLIKPYHETVIYTGESSCGTGWRFTYENRDEPCYTGHKHNSNGFYVYENKKGHIYMKCMSTKCNGIKYLNIKKII